MTIFLLIFILHGNATKVQPYNTLEECLKQQTVNQLIYKDQSANINLICKEITI